MIVEWSEASAGKLTPTHIKQIWPRDEIHKILALIDIRNAEFNETVDMGKDAATKAADKADRMKRAGKIKALHKRMLKKLNTQTFADLAAMEGKSDQEVLVEKQVELAKKHNANINPAMLPPARK